MFTMEHPSYLKTGLPGFLTQHAVEIHVTKHHQAYIDTANKLIVGSGLEGKSIEEVIQKAQGPLFNNVAQHFNHSFFWKCLTPEKVDVPSKVADVLASNFESVEKFKETFTAKASTVFGSGWCYLYKNKDGKCEIGQYSNAVNPVKDGHKPLLTVDTWEHAWYIDYENRKAEYFKNFWNHVNWNFVEQNMKNAGL
ncbi:iron superoxide dismutase, putative [Trichomonas vaginalis G3]|uniref:Superoxide dismutase n=1 Tax=Trichomonas vaginalis (strain ATCC PRA-98 / G3) TaxID=412133 RepID=A2EQX2_TRIV3|nr:iron superoxide dismutase [Trichomonas vaginalis G3]EAY04946.1 iron superoxide dismutase, putative [Trichomonas vaginalis G3]KAI5508770.1 iron superoxide dismutase [Trichomonas vaginalis G3]|eukprot:XP_001317169.1 iron superoxide dismutase [Trichomonas vaginalis G3]